MAKYSKEDIPNLDLDTLFKVGMSLANKIIGNKLGGMTWEDLPDINSLWDHISEGMSGDDFIQGVKDAVDERLSEMEDDMDLFENKKTVQITTSQLQQIIKEGVAKLHKKTLIENRIKQINEELGAMYPKKLNEIGFDQDGNSYGFDNDYSEEAIIQFDREHSDNPDEYIDPRVFSQIDEEDVSDNETQYHDLFEYYEEQPPELKQIVDKYEKILSRHKNYEVINKFRDEVGKIGYTFDSGLDAEPYGLRPIGVELNQLKGWEDDYNDTESSRSFDNMDFLEENEEVASPEMINTINGYLEAALWTEEDELGPSNIESDVSFEAKVDAYTDIKKFKQLAGELIAQSGLDDEQIGHDLWLTRNGHGTGFWDRGLGEIGDKLADIARGMGSKYAYVGDDGLIYID